MQDLPSLLLAAVVWAYWGRVAGMALRIRRRTRTLAGVVPEQGLERFLWLFFVPVVAAWMTLPLLAACRDSGELAIPLAVLALSIASSRVILGMHFLSDVVMGALIGSFLGWEFLRLLS